MNSSRIREFGELSPEEKEDVIKIVKDIDYHNYETFLGIGEIKGFDTADAVIKYLLNNMPQKMEFNKNSILKMASAKQKSYLAVQMKKLEMSFKKDIMIYKKIKKTASDARTVLELDCIALQLVIDQIETLLENNSTDIYQRAQLKIALDRIKEKELSLESYCLILLQNIVIAELQISNYEKFCNQIKQSIGLL